MQPQQPAHVEADEPRSLGLDGRPDRFEAHQQSLPGVGDAGGIGGDEREARATRQRLPQPHPGMDAERLGRQRDLADLLCSAGLRRERGGRLQQLGAALQGDGELEAREENAGDHGANACSHAARMDVGLRYARRRLDEQGQRGAGTSEPPDREGELHRDRARG